MVRFVARFDGKHLLPDEPVNLPIDKPLHITVEEAPAALETPPLNLGKWLDEIEAQVGLAEGPQDLSAELDHYLYGAPKRGEPDGR
jgi:hypothetical protein